MPSRAARLRARSLKGVAADVAHRSTLPAWPRRTTRCVGLTIRTLASAETRPRSPSRARRPLHRPQSNSTDGPSRLSASLRRGPRGEPSSSFAEVSDADSQLRAVACFAYWPTVNTLLLRYLDSVDPHIAKEAARTLGRFGPGAVRPAVAARLDRWLADWTPRREELRSTAAKPSPRSSFKSS